MHYDILLTEVSAGSFIANGVEPWQLYNVNEDPGETRDLAAKHPEKLAALKKLWEVEALKYIVYPLYDDIAARLAHISSMGGAPRNTCTIIRSDPQPAYAAAPQRRSAASRVGSDNGLGK